MHNTSCPMTLVKIVTINILSDLTLWEERAPLLVQGLIAWDPDLIALQEVHIPSKNAFWLAEALGLEHVYLSPKTGSDGEKEGIAILSRSQFASQATLDLQTQNRVAQCVEVSAGDKPLFFVNGHFFWQPGESMERLEQVRLMLKWLAEISGDSALTVCGDFNSTPETSSIQSMQRDFRSAYAVINGSEPKYTAPTPLPRSKWLLLRTLLRYIKELRIQEIQPGWRGTLDYIFVNRHVQVRDCQIVLNRPAQENRKIYPSDHFGLAALLEIG